jgi:hypothetical protein
MALRTNPKTKMKMDFITADTLNKKQGSKRVDFVLSKVKDGTILVTDGVFKPEEEMDLIKETMRRVDDGFPGIEIASIKRPAKGMQSVFEKIIDTKDSMQNFVNYLQGKETAGASMRTGITLIGPAKLIKKIKKNPNSFSVLTEV